MEQTLRPALNRLSVRRPRVRLALLCLPACLTVMIGYRGGDVGAEAHGPERVLVHQQLPQINMVPAEVDLSVVDEKSEASQPTLLDQAIEFIEPFEGRRHRAYRDSRGNLTIGVGFNLDRPGAADDLEDILPGVSYYALRRGQASLTDAQIDAMLGHDTARAIETVRRQIADFDELPTDAQLILIDMTFNTGSLHKWRNLRSAIARQDYAAAADAMHRSQWRRQTGQRAKHLIKCMRDLSQG